MATHPLHKTPQLPWQPFLITDIDSVSEDRDKVIPVLTKHSEPSRSRRAAQDKTMGSASKL